MNEIDDVKRLSNDELVLRISDCVREERRVSASLLAHLAEIDARELYRDLGYESLFVYAVEGLRMSESEAGLRIIAARFARKFPDSLNMLGRGELHLTAMKLLSRALTEDNRELLALACHKTKHEVQLLIAKHCPQPDAPTVMRRLPAVRTEPASAALPNFPTTQTSGVLSVSENQSSAMSSESISSGVPTLFATIPNTSSAPRHTESATSNDVPAAAPAKTSPDCSGRGALSTPACNRDPATAISEGRYKIQFTAAQHVRDLIREAQDLFRNQLPSGDIGVLFERALELLVAERKKQLFAETSKPRRPIVVAEKTSHTQTSAMSAARVSPRSSAPRTSPSGSTGGPIGPVSTVRAECSSSESMPNLCSKAKCTYRKARGMFRTMSNVAFTRATRVNVASSALPAYAVAHGDVSSSTMFAHLRWAAKRRPTTSFYAAAHTIDCSLNEISLADTFNVALVHAKPTEHRVRCLILAAADLVVSRQLLWIGRRKRDARIPLEVVELLVAAHRLTSTCVPSVFRR